MKKAVCLILLFAAAVLCGIKAYAEGDGLTVQFSKIQLQSGEQFIVTLSITSERDISDITASLTYDPSLLEFVSGSGASNSNGIVSISQPGGGGKEAAVSLVFNALSVGNTELNVSSCVLTDSKGTQTNLNTAGGSVSIIEASRTVSETTEQQTSPTETQTETQTQQTTEETTAEPTQETTQKPSTDANGVPTQGVLVDLKVDKGSLVPPFMYSIHEYSLTVPYEVDKVEIEGKTASLQDHIWYTGNSDCVVGLNVRTITVTDINGVETVYTINVMRLDKEESPEKPAAVSPSDSLDSSSKAGADISSSDTKEKDIKRILNPALYVVLIVLVVSLFIVIVWIKSKIKKKDPQDDEKLTQKQRSRIKISGSKKKK